MMRGIWRLVAIALAACAPVAVSTRPRPRPRPDLDPDRDRDRDHDRDLDDDWPVTLIAVGDVMLARTLATRLSPSPFTAVASILQSADVAVANLECAVGVGGTPRKKPSPSSPPPPPPPRSPTPASTSSRSPTTTPSISARCPRPNLRGARLRPRRARRRRRDRRRRASPRDRRGPRKRLAFLGYVDVMTEGTGFDVRSWEAHGASPASPGSIRRASGATSPAAKANADIVVVMLHTGFEGHWVANVWQRAAAHAAIDAGALVVLGAHPHLLQGVERYKGGFVAYSLGDFVFDGKTSTAPCCTSPSTATRSRTSRGPPCSFTTASPRSSTRRRAPESSASSNRSRANSCPVARALTTPESVLKNAAR